MKGKKHYSGKELLMARRQQNQQDQQSNLRQRVQDINKLKQSMEMARQEMRKRSKEGEET